MDQDDMDYRTLRKIQQQEKGSPLLMRIDQKFYQKFSEHLKNFQRIAEKEDNANKLKLFDDEIQNTKKIAFAIYELREKKIMQAALSKVRGGKPDLRNLLEMEKEFFGSLVDQINISRRKILENETDNEMTAKIERKTNHERKRTRKHIDKKYILKNKITDEIKKQYSMDCDVRELKDINYLLSKYYKYYAATISKNNLLDLVQAILEKYDHGDACINRFYTYVRYFIETGRLKSVGSGNSSSYEIMRNISIPKKKENDSGILNDLGA